MPYSLVVHIKIGMHKRVCIVTVLLINIPVINATIKVTALVSDYNLRMYVKVITEAALHRE